jgi:Transglycosylase SLT domain
VRLRLAALLGATALLAGAAAPASAQIYTRMNSNGVVEATNVPASGGFRLTYVGKGTLIHSRGFFPRAYSGEFDAHIEAAASVYGVAVDLLKAVITAESEFDPLAVSSKGAQGLMQLMPFTARRFGVSDSFDPRQNIFGGAQYLRFLLDMFQGDVALALAGYNAGENAVARFKGIPPFKETRYYVQKIQNLLGGGFPTFVTSGASANPGAGSSPRAAYYTPSSLRPVASTTVTKAARVTPARPQVYYRWNDEAGHVHVAQAPPSDGVTYSMIRALD